MKTQITETQQIKLKKLSEEFRELWESLTPSEKKRRTVFSKFLELQRQIQVIQAKNKNINEKE